MITGIGSPDAYSTSTPHAHWKVHTHTLMKSTHTHTLMKSPHTLTKSPHTPTLMKSPHTITGEADLMPFQHVKTKEHVHGLVLKDGEGGLEERRADLDLTCGKRIWKTDAT